jgi:hypothetical protein
VTCVWGPSSEADLARGGVSPRAKRNSPEGASALERGEPRPRGRSAQLLWRAAGATRVTTVLCVRFGSWISLRFAFFTKRGGFSPVV